MKWVNVQEHTDSNFGGTMHLKHSIAKNGEPCAEDINISRIQIFVSLSTS